jgi:RimJ/RimL family protein N-acetyltransferase
MTAVAGVRDTDRLRLEPIGPEHAGDLWRLHQDDAVAAWHAGPWSVSDAHRNAAAMARAWATDGVGKWVAYDRRTGELVGRGLVEGRDGVHDGARFVLYARGRGR